MTWLGDNMATLHTLTTDVTSWRTRHYALRAAFMRCHIEHKGIDIQYKPGKDLTADALTKVLNFNKQKDAWRRLTLVELQQRGGTWVPLWDGSLVPEIIIGG